MTTQFRYIALISKYFKNNEVFSIEHIPQRGDEYIQIRALKDSFLNHHYVLSTYDVLIKEGKIPSGILYCDLPPIKWGRLAEYVLPKTWFKTPRFLLLCECEVIYPHNWILKYHKNFLKIFTWSSELLSRSNQYVWIKDSPWIDYGKPMLRQEKKKLCVLINSNKWYPHPLELYSERLKAIRWFERNKPDEFDFYGRDWQQGRIRHKWFRAINKLPFVKKLLREKFICYRGTVENKITLLAEYKFALCYENARDIPGYFTEKIFDCFSSGCVPVYLGAPDIQKFIPAECYIDAKRFNNYTDLYTHISTISEKKYNSMLDAIEKFIASEEARKYSPNNFAQIVSTEVVKNIAEANKYEH